MLRAIFCILLLYCRALSADHIILLHGLGRDSSSMSYLGEQLTQMGHECHYINYDSQWQNFDHSLAQIAPMILAIGQRYPDEEIHYIGHSLGGLLAFRHFTTPLLSNRGKCVTLGSPYLGSKAAAWLSQFALMRFIQGPVLSEISSPILSQQELGKSYKGLLCIAGNKASLINLLFFEQTPHDGMVAVESAIPDKNWPHIVVERSHNGLLYDLSVVKNINDFLLSG